MIYIRPWMRAAMPLDAVRLLISHGAEAVWLGASDAEQEGRWVWLANGAALEDTYSNWAEGEPNDYGDGEECASMSASSASQ